MTRLRFGQRAIASTQSGNGELSLAPFPTAPFNSKLVQTSLVSNVQGRVEAPIESEAGAFDVFAKTFYDLTVPQACV